MPVATLTLAGLTPDAALRQRVAVAIESVLELEPGDVLVTSQSVDGPDRSDGAQSGPWAIISIHGSDRGPEATAAVHAAADEAAIAWGDERGTPLSCWVERVLPVPPRC